MEKTIKAVFPALVGLGGLLLLFDVISLTVLVGAIAVLYAVEKLLISK